MSTALQQYFSSSVLIPNLASAWLIRCGRARNPFQRLDVRRRIRFPDADRGEGDGRFVPPQPIGPAGPERQPHRTGIHHRRGRRFEQVGSAVADMHPERVRRRSASGFDPASPDDGLAIHPPVPCRTGFPFRTRRAKELLLVEQAEQFVASGIHHQAVVLQEAAGTLGSAADRTRLVGHRGVPAEVEPGGIVDDQQRWKPPCRPSTAN